jgi:hypothetical protein
MTHKRQTEANGKPAKFKFFYTHPIPQCLEYCMNYKKLTYGLCQLCATSDDEKLQVLSLVTWLQMYYTSLITLLLSVAAYNC